MIQPGVVEEVVPSQASLFPFQSWSQTSEPEGGDPVLQEGVVKEVSPSGVGRFLDLGDPDETGRLNLSFELKGYYDDNIFFSEPGRERGDFVWELVPRIFYESSRREQRKRHFVRAGYDPQWLRFSDFTVVNFFGHRGLAEYRFLGNRIEARFNQRSAQFSGSPRDDDDLDVGGIDADLGRRSEGDVHVSELHLTAELCRKSSMELTGNRFARNFEDPDLADSEEWWGDVFFDHQRSTKTRLGVGARVGAIYIDDSPDHVYAQALVRARHIHSPKLIFELEGGVDFRKYEGLAAAGGHDTLVFRAGVTWLPRDGTELAFEGFREIRPSVSGQSIVDTGFECSFRQRFRRHFEYTLQGGMEDRRYEPSSVMRTAPRDDDYGFIRNRLDYRVGDWATLGIYHEYRSNDSNGGNSFNRNQVGFRCRVDF